MANDLVTLLANNPALVQTGLDEDTLAVSGGGGASRSKRISIKGGVFRLMAGGKEIGAIEDRHMNVIFVKMAHQASRMYYQSGYQEGQKVSPLCWSSDSNAPDLEVKSPMASKCSECEMSVKGSGQGGLGSACRLSWRTAVVLPNDPSGDVMQLVLPATSTFGKEDNGRFPFRPYIQHLASHNVSAGRIVTKMAFDTKSPTPKVMFSPAGAVPETDLETVARQAKSAAAEAAIKMNVYQLDEGEAEAEPQKRPVAKPVEVPEKDISDVVKKWSKK
jgi:hypothetical protein